MIQKQTTKIAALSLINQVITFIVLWSFLNFFGANKQTDAVFLSIAIIQFFISLLDGTFGSIIVTHVLKEKENIDKKFCSFFFVIMIITLILVSIAILIVLGLKTYGVFESSSLKSSEVNSLLFYSLLFAFIQVLQTMFSFYHNAREYFVGLIAKYAIANTVGIILFFSFKDFLGIYILLAFYSFRAFIHILLLLNTSKFLSRKYFKIDQTFIKGIFKTGKPLFAWNIIFTSDVILEKSLAFMDKAGTLSLFNFAQTGIGAFNELYKKALVNPFHTAISLKELDRIDLAQNIATKIKKTCFIGAVLLALVYFVGPHLFSFIFYSKEIGPEKVELLTMITLLLFGMLVFGPLGQITSSYLIRIEKQKLLSKLNIINFGGFSILKVIAFNYFGIKGLALTSSIGYFSYFYSHYYFVKKDLAK